MPAPLAGLDEREKRTERLEVVDAAEIAAYPYASVTVPIGCLKMDVRQGERVGRLVVVALGYSRPDVCTTRAVSVGMNSSLPAFRSEWA